MGSMGQRHEHTQRQRQQEGQQRRRRRSSGPLPETTTIAAATSSFTAASPRPRPLPFPLLVLLAFLLLCSLAAGPAAVEARVDIVTENPSPFAAVDPDAPKYVVGLYDDAAKAPPLPPAADGLPPLRFEVMAAADGSLYNCSLPPPEPGTVAGDAGMTGAMRAAGSDARQLQGTRALRDPSQQRSPFELLDPLSEKEKRKGEVWMRRGREGGSLE